jgi:hypothetical protein
MNYPHFHEKITVPYRVGLVGWDVPFVNPSVLSEEHLKELIKAWKDKTCYFKKLSAQEMKAHEAQFEADVAAGKMERATRKTRKDKGGRHAKSKDTISDDDDDDEGEEEVVAPVIKETRARKSAKSKKVNSDTTGNDESGHVNCENYSGEASNTAHPRQHRHQGASSGKSLQSQSAQREKSNKRRRKDESTEAEHPEKRTRTTRNKRVPT